jgi:hypothetical protein
LNNPELLRLIGTITGCQEISEFRFGAVYRMLGPERHEISWHNDLSDKEDRLVGLSLNLSTGVFDGGEFELRECATKKLLACIGNTGFGDALLFRVSPELEHRVTPIGEAAPKTAFTGWFCATGQTYLERLVNRMNH